MMKSLHGEGDELRYAMEIPESWMQGRTTFGGLSAAICFEVAQRSFENLPPLRSAQIAFAGPAGGAVSADARALRQGKSVTFIESNLTGEKGLATRSVFAFGAARASKLDFDDRPPPDVPAPDASPDFFPAGVGPAFAQHFDVKRAGGGVPFSGSDDANIYVWVRHKDASATSMAALIALADMPPPAVFPMFTEFAPISTMSWVFNLFTAAPATKDGWWLMQSRAENARDGYTSQDMIIWNTDGAPVLAGRQSIAIFI